MPEPKIDFRGFAAAAAAAAKPDYADVVARAERHRRRRGWFGATFVALAVAIGGGTTFALTADRAPKPVRPAPIAEVRPWKTVVPSGSIKPKPQPGYIEIRPGLWDPKSPDVPLTGIFTELMAGDIDHLYLDYQDCRSKPCKPMLASSADRGRTWRKLPLPEQHAPKFSSPRVVQVLGSMVLATSWYQPDDGENVGPGTRQVTYWVSADAGGTWRQAQVRDADALPAGRPVFQGLGGDVAVDPATWDVVRLGGGGPGQAMLLDVPPGAGLWRVAGAPGGGLVAEVSQDGGRTWDKRPLPKLPPAGKGAPSDRYALWTTDGRTVYFVEKLRDSIRLHASGDGGRTWSPRAEVDLNGPLLSVLPIDDRTVIVEGTQGTYRSTDQGRTFTRVGPSLGSRAHAIPGGFTIPTNNNEYSAWISLDGAEWTYVHHPEVP